MQPSKQLYTPTKINQKTKAKITLMDNESNVDSSTQAHADLHDEVMARANRMGGLSKSNSWSFSFLYDGTLDFIVSSKKDEMLAKNIANQMGVPLTITYLTSYRPSPTGMYLDSSPYSGGIRVVMSEDLYSIRGCTIAYPYSDSTLSRGSAALITAGHCTEQGHDTSYVYTWTSNSSMSLNGDMIATRAKDSLNRQRNSFKMSRGGYNGDVARLNVKHGSWVKGERYVTNRSAVDIVGYESGRDNDLIGDEICWTGSTTGGTRCGLRVSRVRTTIKTLGDRGIFTPMTEAFGPYRSCPKPGDSGGTVYKKSNKKVIGVLSSIGSDKDADLCFMYFTGHYDVMEAFPGRGLTKGSMIKG